MRLAIFAAPSASAESGSPPGALDGEVLQERLLQDDTRFEVVTLDPSVDLAEQLDSLFDTSPPDPGEPVLFHASCPVVISVENELYLCLDSDHPETGDALQDVTAVFRDRARGPVLFVIECRHTPDPGDPFRSATVGAAARAAVNPSESGVALLVAAAGQDGATDRPSPFTRALVEALDEGAPTGFTAEELYERIQESEVLLGVVPCFAYARGKDPFELVVEGRAPVAREPEPPSEEEAVGDDEPTDAQGEPPEVDEEQEEEGEAHAEDGPTDEVPTDEEPTDPDAPSEEHPPSRRTSVPPMSLPEARSFLRVEADLPRVIVSDRPPAAPAPASSPPSAPPAAAEDARTAPEHLEAGDRLVDSDPEGALREFKAALGLMAGSEATERADVYVRIGELKGKQDKRREAISNFEKALHLTPGHRPALERLIDLNVGERDWRAVHGAEDRLLGTIADPKEQLERLVEFGARSEDVARDDDRARQTFERARAIDPDHLGVLGRLRRLYEVASEIEQAVQTRRRIAELTTAPRERARHYYELAQYCFYDLKREELGLELFDLALESDPSMLEPLEIVATVFAERQEYGELERAYRRMLERVQRIPKSSVRTEVTWELCRRLGLLYRDHLEDPKLALDAFEDAVGEKPGDAAGHLIAADLARKIGNLERAAVHLQAAAALEPTRVSIFHDLFEVFQRLRRPDQAYAAASVTVQLRGVETRERFVFEEHRPDGVPKLGRPLRRGAWELLRAEDRDRNVEAILTAVAPAAIAVRLVQLIKEGRVPPLDAAARQDPEKSTASIVRSFKWASHYLGVPAPAVYVRDDTALNLAAVPVEEPSVIAGAGVLRGKSLPELAFLVGRHLAYYVPPHRLLLYYQSLEDLSACFVAAVKIALPGVPIPKPIFEAVTALRPLLEAKLGKEQLADLKAAVEAFEVAGTRADLARWVAAVERCATRAGLLLCGDLNVAAGIVSADPRGVVPPEEKIADLNGFVVSDHHHELRKDLGVAIEP